MTWSRNPRKGTPTFSKLNIWETETSILFCLVCQISLVKLSGRADKIYCLVSNWRHYPVFSRWCLFKNHFSESTSCLFLIDWFCYECRILEKWFKRDMQRKRLQDSIYYVRYLGRQGLTLHGDYKDEERNVNIRSGISFYHGGWNHWLI